MQSSTTPLSIDALVPSLQKLQEISPFGATVPTPVRMENFLRFAVQSEVQMLLPVTAISEVKKLSTTDILPVPQTPLWVLGLYALKGQALWILDLACRLGYSARSQTAQARHQSMLIVLEVEDQRLGLVVPQIYDIEWYDPGWFSASAPPDCAPHCVDLVAGYEPNSGLLLLNPQRFLQSNTLMLST